MEKLRQEYLVSYDIEDNKIRKRLHNDLLGYGLNAIQKSVFWGYLSLAELEAIKRNLEKHLGSTDKVFVTHSNFNGRGKSYFIGHEKKDFNDWEESGVI